jgi:predicted amidophosphoribosyltransferase
MELLLVAFCLVVLLPLVFMALRFGVSQNCPNCDQKIAPGSAYCPRCTWRIK